jgi:hypothetical protein
MPTARIFIRQRRRFVVVAEQLLWQRRLIRPASIRQRIRLRFRQGDARRIRRLRACLRGTFFRGRLNDVTASSRNAADQWIAPGFLGRPA